jgi:hypothetical protein
VVRGSSARHCQCLSDLSSKPGGLILRAGNAGGISDETDASGRSCCGSPWALCVRGHGAGRLWRHAGRSEYCRSPASRRAGGNPSAAHAAKADVAAQRPARAGRDSASRNSARANDARNRRTIALPSAARFGPAPCAVRPAQRLDPHRGHGRRRCQVRPTAIACACRHELPGRRATRLPHPRRRLILPVPKVGRAQTFPEWWEYSDVAPPALNA